MTDQLFNCAKGRHVEWASLPAANSAILVVLFQGSIQVDDTLNNHDDLASVKASNTECTFINYARKIVTTGIVITVNDTTNAVDVDMADLVWQSAGQPASGNNTITRAIFCYRPDLSSTDSQIKPISHHIVNSTTNGQDFKLQIGATGFTGAT